MGFNSAFKGLNIIEFIAVRKARPSLRQFIRTPQMVNSIIIRPAVQNKSKSVRNLAIGLEIQLRSKVKYALQSIFTKLTITQ